MRVRGTVGGGVCVVVVFVPFPESVPVPETVADGG